MKDVYVLTGATGGIGMEYAKRFTEDALLVISDVSMSALIDLKAELDSLQIDNRIWVSDLSSKRSIHDLVEYSRTLGHFKALIHTAGLPYSYHDIDKIYEVNLIGFKCLLDRVFDICDESVVIVLSSILGHLIKDNEKCNELLLDPLQEDFIEKMEPYTKDEGINAYSLSKKGIQLIVQKDVSKFAMKKTRVVSVSCGAVENTLTFSYVSESKIGDTYVDKTPMSRMATPSEIVDLINFLTSDKATFISGVDVLIDGGMKAHMKYNKVF